MTTALKAAEDLKNLANRFKGVIEAGEYLQELGDLQQATQEAKNGRDAARKEAEEAKAILAELQSQIKSADQSIAKAREEAAGIVREAEERSKDIVTDANAQGFYVKQEAERRRDEFIREGNGHKKSLENIQAQIAEETKKLQGILAEIENAKKRISSI